jgi:hypothetical protein
MPMGMRHLCIERTPKGLSPVAAHFVRRGPGEFVATLAMPYWVNIGRPMLELTADVVFRNSLAR